MSVATFTARSSAGSPATVNPRFALARLSNSYAPRNRPCYFPLRLPGENAQQLMPLERSPRGHEPRTPREAHRLRLAPADHRCFFTLRTHGVPPAFARRQRLLRRSKYDDLKRQLCFVTVFFAPRRPAIHHRLPFHSPPIPCASRARPAVGGAPPNCSRFRLSADRWVGKRQDERSADVRAGTYRNRRPFARTCPPSKTPQPAPKWASHQGQKRS